MAQTSDTEILARAGNHVITHKDFEEAMQGGGGQEQYRLQEDRLDLLKELVRIVIFSNEAREAGLDKDPELQRIIDKIVNFHLARAYVQKYVKDSVQVSENEAVKYYENHRSYFIEPEKIKVRQIFIYQDPEISPKEDKKSLARNLLERIQKGEDFGALSRAFSDDQELNNKDGDLGYVARGALSPEYEDVVFGLDVGQVSPVLEGAYGYSIFKNEGRKPGRLMPFEEVRETVIERMTQEKENDRFLQMEKQLYEKYQIQLFEEKIK